MAPRRSQHPSPPPEAAGTPQKRSIREWNEDDRPREKLLAKGVEALSDAELLAILIRSGKKNESAVDLMRRVLAEHDNSLSKLGRLAPAQLCRYKGLGEAKAVTILAACELGRRRATYDTGERPRLDSSRKIFSLVHERMRDLPTEEFRVLLLNKSLHLIADKRISLGGLAATVVDVRIVLREALLAGATAMVLCHNHPSGNCRPSVEDDRMTQRMKRAAETIDLQVLDHIVVGDGAYFSYADEGRL